MSGLKVVTVDMSESTRTAASKMLQKFDSVTKMLQEVMYKMLSLCRDGNEMAFYVML